MPQTVSIALCTFNGERFLRQQLESYSAQTRLPDEVIVCDDRSTDGTLAILETWAETVPFEVKIIRNPQNLGYAQNFGKAISLCSKDVIFLSDQDDVWEPEKIEKMTAVFEEDPKISAVTSDSFVIDANGKRQEGGSLRLTQYWRFEEAAAFCMTGSLHKKVGTRGCATAIRQNLKPLLLPIPSNWTHDIWLMVIAPLAGTVKVLPEPLFSYRLHSTNTSADGSFSQRLEKLQWSKKNYYWNMQTQYWVWLPAIETFRQRCDRLPDLQLKRKISTYLHAQDRYYTYRNRIQRHGFVYGIFWLLLLFRGDYFHFPFPVKSMTYDLSQGFCKIFTICHQSEKTVQVSSNKEGKS